MKQRLLGTLRLIWLLAIACVLPLAITFLSIALLPVALAIPLATMNPILILPALLLIASIWIWLRFLFKSFPPPSGRRISLDEVPEFKDWFEGIRVGWEGPLVPHVRLVRTWGLGLWARPVMGLLGWCRFHWEFGVVPLMALSLAELECLLAWEMAYWSKQHGWLNLEIKRLSTYWREVERLSREVPALHHSESFEQSLKKLPARLFHAFVSWICRRLDPFIIEQCFAVDRGIANHYGGAQYARALLRFELLEPMCKEFIFSKWDGDEGLPSAPLDSLQAFLRHWPMDAEEVLKKTISQLESSGQSLLPPRLKYLGVEPHIPIPPTETAVLALFKPPIDDVLQDLEQSWLGIKRRKEESRSELERLDTSIKAGGGTPEEISNWGWNCLESGDPGGILPPVDRAIEQQPRNAALIALRARVNVRLGNFEAMEEDLNRLVSLHPYNWPEVHLIRALMYEQAGDKDAAEASRKAMEESQVEVDAARRERAAQFTRAQFLPHNLDGHALDPLVQALAEDRRIISAWLSRRRLTHMPERPYLILVVRPSWFPWRWAETPYRQALARDLASKLPFPAGCDAFVQVGSRMLTRPPVVAEIPGTKIFSRVSPVQHPPAVPPAPSPPAP